MLHICYRRFEKTLEGGNVVYHDTRKIDFQPVAED